MEKSLSSEDWQKIRRATIFADLDDETFQAIIGVPRIMQMERGQTLFHQGDHADFFYVVLDGWVMINRDESDGSRAIILLIGPGDSFAEVVALKSLNYHVSAEAATPLRLVRFGASLFRKRALEDPALTFSIIAIVSRRMQRMVDQVQHLKSWSVERRVAETLLSMCGNSTKDHKYFTLPVEQTQIAAYLAMTASTFSRVLKRLGNKGVEAKYGKITIKDTDLLSTFVATGEEPS